MNRLPAFLESAQSGYVEMLEPPISGSACGQPLRSCCFETSANFSGIRSILFPEPAQIRSRKVVSRSNARSAGKYPNWKTGRMMHWESSNELNAFRLLDCDPSVTSYGE